MSDTASPDHFFSALEILSATATSTDPVNPQPPTYADDSILICSLPDTPLSPAPTPSAADPTKLTADLPMRSNALHAVPTRKPRSVVSRRGRGAKISSYNSDEENQGGNKNVSPSFGSSEEDVVAAVEEPGFSFLDIVKMLSEKPNERLVDMDILEVAAMKGIRFSPPRWWKPGGYGSAEKLSL